MYGLEGIHMFCEPIMHQNMNKKNIMNLEEYLTLKML